MALLAIPSSESGARGVARRCAARPAGPRCIVAGLLLFAAVCACAADDAPRPRVGLVLGGGGARGAAHIGVLEVMQRLRVPVDCVAGTSMGALITGALAAGLTPADMREAMAKANWRDMFQDDPSFFDMSYRNKRMSQQFLPASEVGVTPKGLEYPPGAVSGQKIKAFFNELVHADRGERWIQDLPLPISLIATDIGTGGRVVMREGSLTQAMRASMSVPGVMAPVERDGMKLVDGGLVDNVPIREARERCNADVVIAVNVGSPLLKPDEVVSLFSVAAQMVNILTEQNVSQSLALLKPTDILIKPDLHGITAGDFTKSSETADRGRAAAEAVAEQLRRLSVSEEQFAIWRQRIDTPELPPARVDAIEIAQMKLVNPAEVERQISQKTGDPLNTPALNEDLLRVYGEGYFERVDYRLLRTRDRNILRILPLEKPWGPDYLRFGVGLESDRSGSTYDLRVAYQKTWVDALGAELLAAAEIGNRFALALNYYQPLDAQQLFFVEPSLYYQRQQVFVFQNDQKLAQLEVSEFGGELAFGVRLRTLGQAKISWRETRKWSDTEIGLGIAPPYRVTYGGAFAGIDLDQLDRIYNPRNGWAASADYFAADGKGYSKLQAQLRGAQQVGHDWVVQGRVSYQGSPVGRLPVYDLAKLGGFLNLSAFSRGQLTGDDASYAGLRIERILGELPLGLRGDMRLGIAVEAGHMGTLYTETQRTGWQDSIGIYLGGETPVGPVFIGGAYSTTSGYWNVYLNIGIH